MFTLFTDLTIIVDRSGSMASMNGAQIEQIYKLLNDQKQMCIDENITTYITLTTFDNQVETIMSDKLNECDIPSFEFFQEKMSARGTTKFYDTVIDSVCEQKMRIKQNIKKEAPREVQQLDPPITRILYILTDGYDNASIHSRSQLKEIMEAEQKDPNFTVVFLGANIGDVEETAATYGFTPGTALTIGNDYNSASVAMREASSLIRHISQSSDPTQTVFSPLQRQMSAKPVQQPF